MKDVNILINNGVNVQASLELLGDMEMYDETLNDFLDLVNEKVAKLEKFKAENDMPNYAIEVHALKSDARYLGFLQLGDLAYDSEMKSKAGDTAGVEANHPNIIAQVTNMVNVACSYLGRTVEGFGSSAPAQTAAPVAEPQVTPQPQVQTPVMQSPVEQAQVAQQVAQPQVVQSVVEPQVTPQPVQPVVAQVQAVPQIVEPQVQVQQPVQPQSVPVQPVQPTVVPVQTVQQVVQPQMQPSQVGQVNQVYDLMTGQMVSEGAPIGAQVQAAPLYNPMQPQMQVQQPTVQPTMDPMSQALYQQQQQASHQMPTNLAPKEGTILVVDDSNLVANFVKKIFNAKYDVVIANDGAKAIELCQNDEFRKKIKACLLDLNMPNVDGYQVLEDFKQKGYFVRMPVAVISGVEDLESIDRVNNYPIIDILAKPFNERDVQRVVEKCLAAYF